MVICTLIVYNTVAPAARPAGSTRGAIAGLAHVPAIVAIERDEFIFVAPGNAAFTPPLATPSAPAVHHARLAPEHILFLLLGTLARCSYIARKEGNRRYYDQGEPLHSFPRLRAAPALRAVPSQSNGGNGR